RSPRPRRRPGRPARSPPRAGVGVAAATITDFTDPGCPFAFSAEPFRWRLRWIYGEQIAWRTRMVGLAETVEEQLEKGFDPARQSAAFAKLSSEHHMPIDTSERPRMAATIPACRAVVAARLHAPEAEAAVLRRLRVRHFSGELLDLPETIAGAAVDAGIDPAELGQWTESAEVADALAEDMRAARHPVPAALALDGKLAGWSGGRRYTCPSYEIVRPSDGRTIAIPGFQPASVSEVVIANLDPQIRRREDPETVEQVLAYFDEPLSTAEIAAVMGASIDETRTELARVGAFDPVGLDGWWTLPVARAESLAA
ncbi:MAG TPA: DsbA family protein, partial [Solirubrobacteraceae bacterium]|nr:DsbA family protein [Solirubrobacteraceae bacterium]